MAPPARRTRSLVRDDVAQRDRALRRLRRMTAVIAAVAVLAVASVSALAAATKPGTSKATAAGRAAAPTTPPARRTAPSHPRRRHHERRHREGRRRVRGADDDAAAGHDRPRRRSRLPRPRSRRPPSSRRPPRPRSPPAAREPRPTPLATLEAIGTTAVVVVEDARRARGRAPAGGRARRHRPRVQPLPPRFRADARQRRGRAPDADQPAVRGGRAASRCGPRSRPSGAVDPTVAPALVALGYDRDFAAMDADAADDVRGIPAAGWRSVALDARRRLLRLSPGCRLDLGATAKALAADRAARAPSPRRRARPRSSTSAATWRRPAPPRPAAGSST